ncbi:MAG: enoyl-CoA hydratase/isomerase family protein [Rhodobacteraceae bacterium]|nr:enoyl-CoA hydratase/isomerase family protein [Paracoccaceae bacterium]
MHLTLGPVAEIRIDNPAKLNALTAGMLAALVEHCGAIERARDVRAVVVTAEGERAFCAGADMAAWAELSPADFARHWVRDGHRAFDRLARLSAPTVAAISGHAFGGGLELAAACDIYRRIVIPQLRPAFMSAFVVLAHMAIKSYDLVVALTGGEPGTATKLPATFMYSYTFTRNQMGIGAASAVIMPMMIGAIIVPYLWSELRERK